MIDSHTHLYDPIFDADREGVLGRARETGVQSMIAVGCDLETSRRAVELADRHDELHATIGVHPHEAKDADDAVLSELENLAAHPKVVGYGEIGLDYYYLHSSKETQQRLFRTQIGTAKRLCLPIVIHSRDAKSDTLAILKEEGADAVGGVMHCFTGDLEMAQAAIDLNFHISFSGVLTFANARALRETARRIPLERILVETDCPYLAPVPHRGRRNEPAYVRHTVSALAELHPSMSMDDMIRTTASNTARLFRLKP
ncbi:MAG: TatD family hydrolase [Nitrospirae bacterium]|nr:TatD family hydrolase [Nitrospirota bacterium]